MEETPEKRGWLQGAKTWAKKKLAVIQESSDTLKAIRRYTKGGTEHQDEDEHEKSQASSTHTRNSDVSHSGPWESQSQSRGWQGEIERQQMKDEESSQGGDMRSNVSVTLASGGRGLKPQASTAGHFSKVINSKSPDSKLGRVRLVQDLPAHQGIVWCAALSRDNTMLATGGQDGILRIWKIIPAIETEVKANAGTSTSTQSPPPSVGAQRKMGHRRQGSSFSNLESLWGGGPGGIGGPIPPPEPVIDPNPLRIFEGHAEDILDISWSKGNMILTASVDKTTKLWHVNEAACLRTFSHPDFVTSVRFHPVNLHWFATGCADGRVRLWDIPGTRILASSLVQHDMITAVAFTSDQKIIVGTLKGVCRFYRYNPFNQQMPARGGGTVSIMNFGGSSNQSKGGSETVQPPGKLEYLAQVDVKDQRSSSSSSGSKITGLLVMSDDSLIVTSADSRLRRYLGYAQQCKYKGLKATSTMIRASLSPCGQHLISGSEDGRVYIWDTFLQGEQRDYSNPFGPSNGSAYGGGGGFDPSVSLAPKPRSKNMTYESFSTEEATVTIALMAPHSTWRSSSLRSNSASAQAHGVGELDGAVFLAAGFSGSIHVFENLIVTNGSRVTREE